MTVGQNAVRARSAWLVGLVLLGVVVMAGCRGASSPVGEGKPESEGPKAQTPQAEPAAKREQPSPADEKGRLVEAVSAFNRGGALLEQYSYTKAATTFEEVLRLEPGWTAAQFNLALAYFNTQDRDMIEKARQIVEQILQKDPSHRHALFLLGMYDQRAGKTDDALACFQKVHQADPDNLHAAYKYAEMLTTAGRHQEAADLLQKVVDRDPGFLSGIYRLGQMYLRLGQREKATALIQRFRDLSSQELSPSAFTVDEKYGDAGRYSQAIDARALPLAPPEKPAARILFSPDVHKLDVALKAWPWPGGNVTIPGVAVGDVNGDGHLDLVLAGAGEHGSAQLLLNDGKGKFSAGPVLAEKVVSPCLGDVNNDGHLDLWLGALGQDQLLLNDGKGKFSPAPAAKSDGKAPAAAADSQLTCCARLMDLDSDGDLDLLSLTLAKGAIPPGKDSQAAAIRLANNNRDGSYPEIAAQVGLATSNAPLAAVVYDDFDNDRDLDLILVPASGRPVAWVNDRGGKFHILDAAQTGLDVDAALSGTTGDPFQQGRRDLLVSTGSQLILYRNRGPWKFQRDPSFAEHFGRLGGSGAQFVDVDNDGDLDIFIADAHRRDGSRGPVLLLNDAEKKRFLDAAEVDPGCLLAGIKTRGDAVGVAADFNGDGRVDLLLAEMNESPQWIENVTQGGHYLALDLRGTEERGRKTRSANSPIGARVEVKSGTASQQYSLGQPAGATAMPPLRLHAGLGEQANVDWLRILWPDGVLQAEMEVAGNRLATITEEQRKGSSCPVLFAWDGSRFAFLCDFGGVGGLGYLVAPGQYAPPDPTEYVPVPGLQAKDGQYVVQVMEPLEEVVYFDEAKLMAIDHPAGTEVYPNEMAAVTAAPPAFEVFCVRRPIEPVRAVDHRGAERTDALRRVDRIYAGACQPDPRFHGLAEDHFVELDFGDQLSKLPAGARVVLFANGWVEYGYSSTNYALSQTGLRLKAPSILALRDGRWVELAHEVGYPAGLCHWMTLDLTAANGAGKLLATDRKIRIASNMEIYWDRVFLAVPEAGGVSIREAQPAVADLHEFGYPREYSPDGRQPNLYDYTNVDRFIPWKLMPGRYTRFGDVGELLRAADDCFVVMGPGEELTLKFPAAAFGPLAAGQRRSFLLKTDSYCKDMDLYTAMGETVEPLPFHAMRSYPYGLGERYPDTEKTRDYLRRYNTRHVRAR